LGLKGKKGGLKRGGSTREELKRAEEILKIRPGARGEKTFGDHWGEGLLSAGEERGSHDSY